MMLNLFTIPNILTLFNLLLGCAAAAFAAMGRMEAAVGCIAAAAVCDFADGLAARLFNAHSAVGRQLDSLADVISFGFAPAFMLFVAISANEGGYEGRMPFYFFMLFPFLLTAFSAPGA